MSTTTARDTRTVALRAARAKDSEQKRQRASAAIEALEVTGSPITVTAVAKAAGVSTWLVYAEGIREQVEAAGRRQADHGTPPASAPRPGKEPTTPASLRTDLAIAREEIRRLRAGATNSLGACASSSAPRSTGPTEPI